MYSINTINNKHYHNVIEKGKKKKKKEKKKKKKKKKKKPKLKKKKKKKKKVSIGQTPNSSFYKKSIIIFLMVFLNPKLLHTERITCKLIHNSYKWLESRTTPR